MPCTVIIGTQWGDEGKGKLVQLLAEKADAVVRFGSGDRAGHTIFHNNVKYKFQLIPGGIFSPEKLCILGNGMVLDLDKLIEEMNYLKSAGVNFGNLKISCLAHLVLPYHKMLEQLEYEKLSNARSGKIRKGISAAYVDKVARKGIRVIDFMDEPLFRDKLKVALDDKNKIFSRIHSASSKDFDIIYNDYNSYREIIAPYITDTALLLDKMISDNKKILFEGVRGTFMDMDFGTYPHTSSFHTIAGSACIGSGVGPTRINHIIGVTKSYVTRVDNGPFPTELLDDMGEELRSGGSEYGTTTGKPRRCGWLDLPMLRYARVINGLTGLAITKLDALDNFENIKVCIAYECNGKIYNDFPLNPVILNNCKPVYKDFPGWMKDTINIKKYEDLPVETRNYIEFVSQETGMELYMISVGQQKEQTIIKKDVW